MSDPIVNIINDCAEKLEPPSEDSFVPFSERESILLDAAKEIRQQIGRELLEREIEPANRIGYVYADDIREICQLEEE